jgi:transcriptional regulator of arginine metabolism
MQSRTDRHRHILELIDKKEIETQSQLRQALKKTGFDVNQATLSRDIRELGLVKIASGGRYRYGRTDILQATTTTKPSLARVKTFVREVDWSGNTVVIKTNSGAANPVAEAIDHLGLDEILGTVAGDNTIFIVVRRNAVSRKVAKELESFFL